MHSLFFKCFHNEQQVWGGSLRMEHCELHGCIKANGAQTHVDLSECESFPWLSGYLLCDFVALCRSNSLTVWLLAFWLSGSLAQVCGERQSAAGGRRACRRTSRHEGRLSGAVRARCCSELQLASHTLSHFL